MSFLWTAVSVILFIELIILLILCAPLPWGVRKNISRWIFTMKAHQFLDSGIKYVQFALLLSLLEAVNSFRRIETLKKRAVNENNEFSFQSQAFHEYRWQKARSERNLYLATFSITGVIAIARLIRLASIEVQLRNKIKEYNGNKTINEIGETMEQRHANDQPVSPGQALSSKKSE